MQLHITDLQGKLVMSERLMNEGDHLNRVIGLDRSITTGVYLLNLNVDGKTFTKRLSVL
ncbi:MAG: T9SS type A sorting domain-containing protein [Flavobacteriales bacterium]|nr:T9SS type A sorting domain-containing protein [Flavobacteriales bacterium]